MFLGWLAFILMAVSSVYSLLKWINYSKNRDALLNIHCIFATLAVLATVIHVYYTINTLTFSVEYICLFSMLGSFITGYPLKMRMYKGKSVRRLWSVHIAFAISFIVTIILHIIISYSL